MTSPDDAVRRELELLRNTVSHWGPRRWEGRAARVHALVQRIADLTAAAEGEPPRRVPRLDNDLALPDQLRVVVADLVSVERDPAVLIAAAEDMVRVRRSLTEA